MKKQLITLILCLTVIMTNKALSGDGIVDEQFSDNQTVRYRRHVQQPERPVFVEATANVPTTYHLSDLNSFTWSPEAKHSAAMVFSITAFCLLIYTKFWCVPVSNSVAGCRQGIDFRLNYDNSDDNIQPEVIFTKIAWNSTHITCNGLVRVLVPQSVDSLP